LGIYTGDEMINYAIILFVHLYADTHLQGSHISKFKCDTKYMMALHCTMYSLLVSITLYMTLGIDLWSLPVLVVSHYIIDHYAACKMKLNDWQDLFAHLIIITLIIGGSLCIK